MNITHKIALDPTKKQIKLFERASRASRFVFNWALENWKAQYQEKKEGKREKAPSRTSLDKQFNSVKHEKFRWVTTVSKNVAQGAIRNLDKAYKRFFTGLSRYPRFKERSKSRKSFYIGDLVGRPTSKRVHIPCVGHVKIKEPPRWPNLPIVEATVVGKADKWFVCITYDDKHFTPRYLARKRKESATGQIAAVDVGINNPYTVATKKNGEIKLEHLSAPRPLLVNEGRLRRANKSFARKKLGSKRREKAKKRLQTLHARIANIRHDAIHKYSKRFCEENEVIILETLGIKAMMRTRVAKSFSDLSHYEFRRQVTYKAPLYGSRAIILPRNFASSKTCSVCWQKNEELGRKPDFKCPNCSYEAHRDENAVRTMIREVETNNFYGGSPVSKDRGLETSAGGVKPLASIGNEAITTEA